MNRGKQMAGKKQMPAPEEDEYNEEEEYNEEGEEEEEACEEGGEDAEDEASGAGETGGENEDQIQLGSQAPSQSAIVAARKTMLSSPLDMSFWRTSWSIIVRPPLLCLFKKGVTPSGMDVLENVGSTRYFAVTKKNDAQGKTVTIINIWARKAGVITRYGLQRNLFMASEVRDPGKRITVGKFKNAPDAVRCNR
jgi:cobalamin biosynthesis protein CobT